MEGSQKCRYREDDISCFAWEGPSLFLFPGVVIYTVPFYSKCLSLDIKLSGETENDLGTLEPGSTGQKGTAM